MQVPAGNAAAHTNAAESSSASTLVSKGIFNKMAKKGLLPSFAEMVTEHDIDAPSEPLREFPKRSPVTEHEARLDPVRSDVGDELHASTKVPSMQDMQRGSAPSTLTRLAQHFTRTAERDERADEKVKVLSSAEKSESVSPPKYRKNKHSLDGASKNERKSALRVRQQDTSGNAFPVFMTPVAHMYLPAKLRTEQRAHGLSPVVATESRKAENAEFPSVTVMGATEKRGLSSSLSTKAASIVFPGAVPQECENAASRKISDSPVSAAPGFNGSEGKIRESPLTGRDAIAVPPVEAIAVGVVSAGFSAHVATTAQPLGAKPKLPQKFEADEIKGGVSVRAHPASSQEVISAAFDGPWQDATRRPAGKDSATPEVNSGPFQHLDKAEAPATLLHANAREVVVGVRDPSLGWVEIQTQSSGGHVSASLATASPEAHANLTAQVSSIAQYLEERQVHVHRLDVGMQAGAQQNSEGQRHSASGNAEQQASRREDAVPLENPQGIRPLVESANNTSVISGNGASYISVRA